jgi:chromosomal replication initiator protein
MQAIGHQVFLASRTSRVCYLSAESFLNEYIESLQNKSPTEFRKKYRGIDVLLLDDVHFLAGKTGIQEEFFHTFNALFDSRKQIVLTCDRPLSEIHGLEPRLVSRFEWGLVTELSPPDLETRVAILRKKAASMNVALSSEVMLFIAENIRTDMRKLEGALTRAVSYASLLGQPLTAETVGHLLRDSVDRTARAPSMDLIQRAVAETYDLRISDMTSKRRPQAVALPRQIAMYLCRTLTDRSLPAIGEAFSRNHATVIHACRTVEGRIRRDPSFRDAVETLRSKLSGT